ncbi:MAG: methyltransferase domain-containing protein [Blastopirellula sp. JB062]
MSDENKAAIQSNYGAVATSGLSSEHAGVKAIAEAFGYSEAELRSIPAGANMGLSCGNPTATANLREGEVVVDLGCGGGLDVFLAAAKVGPTGKSIGIDMTQPMIDLAQKNAAAAEPPLTNVEFHLATIDAMPLESESVDCVISNCVINLAPDKKAVFREIARVLKSGGRVAVSDIALKKPLPEELATDISALVGCIGGAIPIAEYRQGLLDAGFAAVDVVDDQADLNAYANVDSQAGCCSPTMSDDPLAIIDTGCCDGTAAPLEPGIHQRLTELLKKYDVNDYAASVKVYAVKP